MAQAKVTTKKVATKKSTAKKSPAGSSRANASETKKTPARSTRTKTTAAKKPAARKASPRKSATSPVRAATPVQIPAGTPTDAFAGSAAEAPDVRTAGPPEEADSGLRATPTVGSRIRAERRWIAVIAAALVAVLFIVLFAQTRRELSRTRDTLAATSGELATTEGGLREMTKARDTLAAQLKQVEADLSGVRKTADDSKRLVELQSGQITSLKSCLDGIDKMFTFFAGGNDIAAEAAISAVESDCEKSFELIKGQPG